MTAAPLVTTDKHPVRPRPLGNVWETHSPQSFLSESARLGSTGTGPSSLPSVLVPWGQQEPSLPHSESWHLIFQVPYSVASSALVCLKNSRRQMEINIIAHCHRFWWGWCTSTGFAIFSLVLLQRTQAGYVEGNSHVALTWALFLKQQHAGKQAAWASRPSRLEHLGCPGRFPGHCLILRPFLVITFSTSLHCYLPGRLCLSLEGVHLWMHSLPFLVNSLLLFLISWVYPKHRWWWVDEQIRKEKPRKDICAQ